MKNISLGYILRHFRVSLEVYFLRELSQTNIASKQITLRTKYHLVHPVLNLKNLKPDLCQPSMATLGASNCKRKLYTN